MFPNSALVPANITNLRSFDFRESKCFLQLTLKSKSTTRYLKLTPCSVCNLLIFILNSYFLKLFENSITSLWLKKIILKDLKTVLSHTEFFKSLDNFFQVFKIIKNHFFKQKEFFRNFKTIMSFFYKILNWLESSWVKINSNNS